MPYTLLFLLLFLPLSKEKSYPKYKYYSCGSGFCANNLLLYDDYRFFQEAGCEGNSRIAAGTWKMHKDTVILSFYKKSEVNIVRDVQLKDMNYDGKIHVRVKSIEGDSVDDDLGVVVLEKSGERPTLDRDWFFGMNKQDYILDTANNSGKIEITKLSVIFDTRVLIDTKGKNDITIFLDLPQSCLWAPNTTYEYETGRKLLIKQDTLYSLPLHELGCQYILTSQQ